MSKENQQPHSHHGSSNSFLMGAIIGGGLVFLLATKKGRQILKTLTENGFEGLSEITDLLNDEEDEEILKEEYVQDGEVVDELKKEEPKQESPKKSLKRFFRGIKK